MKQTIVCCLCLLLTASLAAASSGKRITVDLDHQLLKAYEGETLVHDFHAVTGSCAKWTHPGDYQVDRKVEDYGLK